VDAGEFREDLFFRLCVVPVTVPPLRERRDDIPLLVCHFLRQFTDRDVTVSDDALAALTAYEWPGNVRELQNALHLALVRCKTDVLKPEHLPAAIGTASRSNDLSARGRKKKLTVEQARRALEKAGGNKREAARILGISPTTLYSYLEDTETS
jgi:DNA-binding NtrC family response regulator